MHENRGFILLCCLLGSYLLFQIYDSQYDATIGDILPVLLTAALGATLFFIALFRVARRDDLTINQRLIPLYFWFGPVLIGVACGQWLNRIDGQPNAMRVSTGADAIMACFDFKKNGRYKYTDGSPLGVFYNYGSYTQLDSIIILTPQSARNAPTETGFIIRPYSRFKTPHLNQKSVLYPIDKTGQFIGHASVY